MHLITELLKGFLPGQSGFLFMWGLAVMAFIAAVIIIERWIELNRRLGVDAPLFTEKIRGLILDGNFKDAYQICLSGGERALPSVFRAGIEKAATSPQLVTAAMEEEFLRIIPAINRRISLVLTFGHVSTLLGLMGTIYGLILSFSAVGKPGVAAVAKSALLASGISTAMNTTLFGLTISIPCILAYSMFRSRIDAAVTELDRYVLPVVKTLLPEDATLQDFKFSVRRVKEEADTEPNIGPMMSLLVILIPLLLTSAEFIKIGAIEIKTPASSEETSLLDSMVEESASDLGLELEVTKDGFNISHYFKKDETADGREVEIEDDLNVIMDIPLVNGSYDFKTLRSRLAEAKRAALFRIVSKVNNEIPSDIELAGLFFEYSKMRNLFTIAGLFTDHEDIRITADDAIEYQTLVSVMDTARDMWTEKGRILMFPNVSLLGSEEFSE